MKLPTVLVSLALVGSAGADARKPRPVGDNIFRVEAASLPEDASRRDVAAALVGGRWMYLNPEKKTSTWESRTYVFHDDGTVETTTNDLSGPVTDKGAWTLVVAPRQAPFLTVGAVRYRIVACSRGTTATLCLAR